MGYIKDLVLWIYWYPFKIFIQKMPTKYVYLIARISGFFLYRVAHNKRNMLKKELIFIFDNKLCNKEKDKFVKDAFKVLVCNELEVLLFPILNRNNISSFVTSTGIENLDYALSNNKGAMLLFAHFGANQMIMPAIGYMGYKMCQLSAPATVWKDIISSRKISIMEERAMKKRSDQELSLPVKHINIFGTLKEAFLCLKRNEVLGIAVDGGGGRDRKSFKFLGKTALFSCGAIDIARRTGCIVLPAFMIRDENGYNRMIIERPVHMSQGKDVDEIITKTMQNILQKLESYVLKYPGHYLNFLALRRFMVLQGDKPFFI